MAARTEEDASLVILARELASRSLGQSSEDLVSMRSDRASVSGLDKMMDPEKFRANLVALQVRLEEGSPETDTRGAFPHRVEASGRARRLVSLHPESVGRQAASSGLLPVGLDFDRECRLCRRKLRFIRPRDGVNWSKAVDGGALRLRFPHRQDYGFIR